VNLIVKDPLQRRIEFSNWIILAVIFFPSLFLASYKFALGILLGGFISIVNFYWMEKSLRGAFGKKAGSVKGSIMVKYFLRLALTGVVLYFLITNETVNVIGLVIGLSVVIINIITITIISLTKSNFLKEVK